MYNTENILKLFKLYVVIKTNSENAIGLYSIASNYKYFNINILYLTSYTI